MDYTKVPRSLIYKDRTNLNDFGVQDEGTINNYLFTQMRKLTLLRCGNAKEIALQCFNNAYYICTLVQLDEFPDLCMDKYEEKLLNVDIPFKGDVYQASMALVCVLLAAYDDKYKRKDNILIDSIYDWTRSKKWTGSLTHKSFEDIIEKCSPFGYSLAPNTFAPRDIIEAIKSVSVNDIVAGKEYLIEKLTQDDNICINDELESVLMRIRNDLNDIYEEWDFNPQTNTFELDDMYEPDYHDLGDVRDEIDTKRDAIGYFEKFFQLTPQGIEKLIASVPTTIEAESILPTSNVVQQAKNKCDDNMDKRKDNEIAEYKKRILKLQNEIEELKEEKTSTQSYEALQSELNRIKVLHENTLVALLQPAFYKIESEARNFLRKIQGLDNQDVTDVAWQFFQEKKITPSKKGHFIWNILKAAQLYSATEQNWNAAFRKKEEKLELQGR